jgi:hypothetical protein
MATDEPTDPLADLRSMAKQGALGATWDDANEIAYSAMHDCLQAIREERPTLVGDVRQDNKLVYLYIVTDDPAKGTPSLTIRDVPAGQAEYLYGTAFPMGGHGGDYVPSGWEEATPLGYGQITHQEVINIVSFWAHSRVFD